VGIKAERSISSKLRKRDGNRLRAVPPCEMGLADRSWRSTTWGWRGVKYSGLVRSNKMSQPRRRRALLDWALLVRTEPAAIGELK